MPDQVIGRHREREATVEFLTGLENGLGGVLVFAGEPGIGKTTVWQDAVDKARASSFVVLVARPVEAEAGLAFAGLSDLFEPLGDVVLAGLAEPQRRALEVALLRADPGRERIDQRAVSAGTRAVLEQLAKVAPVVVAVDDLQWLDRASMRVLQFAIRRLAELPVGVVASQRIEPGVRPPLVLEPVVAAERLTRLELGPLSVVALREVLEKRLGRPFGYRNLVRIGKAARGNPFFALEIARALPPNAAVGMAALPIPDRLLEVVEARILALPKRTRRVLLAAAAIPGPRIDLVTAVSGGTPAESLKALERAEAGGIINIESSRLRFTHPLFAAAVHALAPTSERRRIHRQLATVTDDIEERARHLAMGAEGTDPGLAALLDDAAEHARARGGPESAVELATWARTLTPPDASFEIRRRTVQIAEYLFRAGELLQAREMLEYLLEQPSTGLERAGALRLLGEIHSYEDSFPQAVQALHEALELTGDDRQLRLITELNLAFAMGMEGDFAAGSEHAGRALNLAELEGESASVAEALAFSAYTDLILGQGLDEAKVERALRLEDPDRPVPILVRPSFCAGCIAQAEGHLERCDQLLLPLRARIQDRGDERDLVHVCTYLTWSASWQGHLALAEEYALQAIQSSERMDGDSLRCMALAFGAVASAYAGDARLTESRAEESLVLMSRTGSKIAVLWASWALALVALSRDDPKGADDVLGPLTAMFERGVPEPIQAFFLPDEIEALISLGRLGEAEDLLIGFEESARRLGRAWGLMLACRCRALLAAAGGDLDGASAWADQTLSRGEDIELRIEVARSFLVAGRIERRRRRKAIAADHLRRAATLFEEMGAALWAERAQAELGRVGLRPAPPAQLTESERRVAELAASGLTNREVSAQLFMSPKTVEANLARIYRKIGVHSRAQLGAHLASLGARGEQK
jgi:DNA-binding CsgD family transcriptional regulator